MKEKIKEMLDKYAQEVHFFKLTQGPIKISLLNFLEEAVYEILDVKSLPPVHNTAMSDVSSIYSPLETLARAFESIQIMVNCLKEELKIDESSLT